MDNYRRCETSVKMKQTYHANATTNVRLRSQIRQSNLTNIQLLDEYRGNSIPKNQTSLCIQLTFQSLEKTLFTKEIEDIIINLQTLLKEKYDVSIRV